MFHSKNSRTNKLALLFCVVFILLHEKAHSEYIYLKDGQVIQGAITKETKDDIFVKTRFQNRQISRSSVKRILYGERKMEQIYIQLIDGSILKGYLVDQDALKVYVKDHPTSAHEKVIPKNTIRQMSNKEIIPLTPSIAVRGGLFMPLNSGKSDLNYAPAFLVGSGINPGFTTNARIFLETGYINSKSKRHDGQFMQFIPITVQGKFYIPVSLFHIVPKIGIGAVIIDYDNSEDPVQRGTSFTVNSGIVLELSIKKKLFVSFGCDYNIMIERSGAMLHSLVPITGLSYRF